MQIVSAAEPERVDGARYRAAIVLGSSGCAVFGRVDRTLASLRAASGLRRSSLHLRRCPSSKDSRADTEKKFARAWRPPGAWK